MGTYDTYGYLGIQIKMGMLPDDVMHYYVGNAVPLPDGLVFGYEGVAVVEGGMLAAVYPYDQMWDKWGEWFGAAAKTAMEDGNPLKFSAALDAALDPVVSQAIDGGLSTSVKLPAEPPVEKQREAQVAGAGWGPRPAFKQKGKVEPMNEREWMEYIRKTVSQVEQEMSEMKPYWMVHRRGKKSGPAIKVHNQLQDAVDEASRLARKEMDSFTILEAVMIVKPSDKPVELDIQPIEAGPLFGALEDFWKQSVPAPSRSDDEMIEKADCPCGCTDDDEAGTEWCPHCGNDVIVETERESKGCCDENEKVVDRWMRRYGVSRAEAKAELCGH